MVAQSFRIRNEIVKRKKDDFRQGKKGVTIWVSVTILGLAIMSEDSNLFFFFAFLIFILELVSESSRFLLNFDTHIVNSAINLFILVAHW